MRNWRKIRYVQKAAAVLVLIQLLYIFDFVVGCSDLIIAIVTTDVIETRKNLI